MDNVAAADGGDTARVSNVYIVESAREVAAGISSAGAVNWAQSVSTAPSVPHTGQSGLKASSVQGV